MSGAGTGTPVSAGVSTVAYTAFLPEITHLVPGAPEPTIINAIRNACIDFCAQTSVWATTRAAVAVVDTDFPYTLVSPSDSLVSLVLYVGVDGRPILPITLDELDSKVYQWRDHTGYVARYYQETPETLGLYQLPNASVNMVIRAAYAPTRDSTTVAEYVYQGWREDIAWGALAKLMTMPDTAWENAALAAEYAGKFAFSVKQAVNSVNKSFTRADLRVQMRPFA